MIIEIVSVDAHISTNRKWAIERNKTEKSATEQ
jgi:hypothetical protein